MNIAAMLKEILAKLGTPTDGPQKADSADRTGDAEDDTAERLKPLFAELSGKLDTVLDAVKSNGEQLRKLAEDDGNTIFFS